MTACAGCGGVIGRDCFNPAECLYITRDMADGWREYQAEQERLYYREQEEAFEAERFEMTSAGVA